jgi:ATP-dependent DNA helicase RecG
MSEKQNIEYKQSWRDEYLKWICGFANAQGGKIYIGIDDVGKVVGLADYKKLMEDIPNKIISNLGLMVDVNLLEDKGLKYIEIEVLPSPMAISYHGGYHYRTGSTKQELKGIALNDFLLKKMGRTWDDMGIESATLDDIDEHAVKSFLKAAIRSGRIYKDADQDSIPVLLENLNLITPEGKLKAAAILLFGKKPSKFFVTSYFKIGKFGSSDSDLKFQDIVEGNIFEMVESVMRLLRERYLISPISYDSLQRIEQLEYPEEALREAVLNAIVHKDYTETTIQLSVYEDRLLLWNPGQLSDGLTIEKLKIKHPSKARNKNIAEIFFKAGYIESWGRGIEKMITSLKSVGFPEPIFEESVGGFQVTFRKELYTKEQLHKEGYNDRQVMVVAYLKENRAITSSEYQKLTGIGKSAGVTDLQELVDNGILKMQGGGRSTKYELNY